MNAAEKIFEFQQRKAAMRSRSIQRQMRQRLQSRAEELTRLGLMRASAELVNEATARLIELIYQVDADTLALANVDLETAIILIPTPWSSHNYRAWGLRSTEAAILRRYLFDLESLADRGLADPPLFQFEPIARRWIVNRDYRTLADALAYWRRHELRPREYADRAQTLRKQRAKAKQRLRNARVNAREAAR